MYNEESPTEGPKNWDGLYANDEFTLQVMKMSCIERAL